MSNPREVLEQLPAAIRAFVETTNAGDSDGFVAAFASDAVLDDWGRTFAGPDRIREWDRTDNIGVQTTFTALDASPGPEADSFVVTLEVRGNGYNGTGPMTFRLRDGLISSVKIG